MQAVSPEEMENLIDKSKDKYHPYFYLFQYSTKHKKILVIKKRKK